MTDIRIRQLVVPTGVGSITHEVTGKHILIRSLDSWHRIRNVSDIDQEFVIDEPRLKLLLWMTIASNFFAVVCRRPEAIIRARCWQWPG